MVALALLALSLSACTGAQKGFGMGGKTFAEFHEEIKPDGTFLRKAQIITGKEYDWITVVYGDNQIKVDAGKVAAFEGQAIEAEMIKGIVDNAIKAAKSGAMPGADIFSQGDE